MEPETKPRFVTSRRVEFVDTDMAGIVHFTNFFRYMEQAEAEFFRSQGHSLASTTERLGRRLAARRRVGLVQGAGLPQ